MTALSWMRSRLRDAPSVLALALAGCSWNLPMSTVEPGSDLARSILSVYGLITWVSVGIFIVVAVLLAWVLVRYRDRPGAGLPAQTHGHTALEIGWTIAPALVLLMIAVPTVRVIFRTQQPPPANALRVVVRGWQWWWEFRYPTLDVVTASELYLPLGRPVALQLEGPDVIHSFWVPRLGGKRDIIPGRHNEILVTPDTPGEYFGQCAEFCGASHANMRMRVVVVAPDAFDRWVAGQRAPAAEPTGAAAEGKEMFARSACVGCHTIRGVSTGTVGPDLTHFASRRTLAGGMLTASPDDLTRWLLDPPSIKPGVKMPPVGLTPAQAQSIAAYLLSLE